MSKITNRISLNGCRYVISENKTDLEKFCDERGINKKWIRFKKMKYYLRLWNRYKVVGK